MRYGAEHLGNIEMSEKMVFGHSTGMSALVVC